MENSKVWYKSKAVLASLVTGICGVLVFLGIKEATGASLEAESIADNIIGLVAIAGSLVAIWGRIKATSKITK